MAMGRGVAVGALALLCTGLAACGGSTGSSGGDALSGEKVAKQDVKCGMGNGQKATGAPIKVRALVTASGGVDFSSSPESAAAFFKCVNANGGIDGRPISYAYSDDGLNLQKSAQIARGFANDKSVVALVGDATFVGCGVANDAYVKGGVYSITGVGVPRSCFHSPNIAPVNAGPRNSAVATAQYLADQGKAARVVQISNNAPDVGDWLQAGVDAYIKSKGLKIAKDILHDPGIKDPSSLILDAKNAKPTMIMLQDPGPDSAALLKSAQQQGLKNKYAWSCLTSCYDAAFPSQVGDYWEGFIANSEMQLVDAKTKDNLLWRQVLDAYGTKDQPRDTFSQAGFLAAKIFTDTLLKQKLKTIDRQTVSNALLGIKGYKTDMLCTPWYFGKAPEHNANHDTRMVEIKDGRWQSLKACEPTQDPDLDSVRAREKAQGLLEPGT